MSPETKTTITLELLADGDDLRGRVLDGSTAHEFSGRLGLMHAIDELLAGKADGPHDQNGRAPGDGDSREEPR